MVHVVTPSKPAVLDCFRFSQWTSVAKRLIGRELRLRLDPGDLISEAMLRVSRTTGFGDHALSAAVIRSMRRIAIDTARKLDADRRCEIGFAASASGASPNAASTGAVARREVLEFCNSIGMSRVDRVVMKFRHRGFQLNEIAGRLRCSSDSVRSRLARIRGRIPSRNRSAYTTNS